MFIGVGNKNSDNDAKRHLGNLIMFAENFSNRILLIGEDKNDNTMLVNIFASNLSFKGYEVETFNESEILGGMHIPLSKKLIIVYDIFSKEEYTEDELWNLKDFLNLYQHSSIFLVFNDNIEKLIDMRKNGILNNDSLWSRNILDCKQIFMNDDEKDKFKEFVELDDRGDYRITNTLNHLNEIIEPYNQINGFSTNDVINEMKLGDNSKSNSLIIDQNRKIRLVTLDVAKKLLPPVRIESFGRGGDFVGRTITEREANGYLQQLLQGYLDYIISNNTQFVDYCERPTESIDETIMKIKIAMKN